MRVAKIRLGGAAEREAGRKLAPQADADNEVEDEAWIDLMKLGSVFSHEGSNLYLRLWQLGQYSPSHLLCLQLRIKNFGIRGERARNTVAANLLIIA